MLATPRNRQNLVCRFAAWSTLALLLAAPLAQLSAKELPRGAGQFIFNAYPALADRPLTVWYWAPEGDLADVDILFVMHGTNRNGDDYRDNWIELAKRYRLLVLTPEFSDQHYPGARSYNLGRMFDQNDKPVPEESWAYSAIEPLFDFVKLLIQGRQESYTMFGHSAGAQFVHRFLWFKPENRARALVSANAGWYTLPNLKEEFPYGLGKTAADKRHLRQALERPLIVLLGDQDVDTADPNLRRTPEALAQGPHRLARGRLFFEQARRQAENLEADFGWRLEVVPRVGHDNAGMAEPAANLLFSTSD